MSLILTSDLIFVTEDFFSWLLTGRESSLEVRHQKRVETLENLVSTFNFDEYFRLVNTTFVRIHFDLIN